MILSEKTKTLKFILVFTVTFVLSYIVMCYLPPLRIKLEASPDVYFWESVKHMASFKAALSAAIGAAFTALTAALNKK